MQKNVKSSALGFRSFGRKIQILVGNWDNFESFWWKFNRKIEFLKIYRTDNRAFGNNITFTTIFSFGGRSRVPPWQRLCLDNIHRLGKLNSWIELRKFSRDRLEISSEHLLEMHAKTIDDVKSVWIAFMFLLIDSRCQIFCQNWFKMHARFQIGRLYARYLSWAMCCIEEVIVFAWSL